MNATASISRMNGHVESEKVLDERHIEFAHWRIKHGSPA